METLNPLILTEACLGAMLGAFTGDAIGSLLQFQYQVTSEQVQQALQIPGGGPFLLSAGQITNNSELAICLASALSESGAVLNLDCIAKWYGVWIDSPPFNCGQTIRNSFVALCNYNEINEDPAKLPIIDGAKAIELACKYNQKSVSSGCLYRTIPLAI